MKTKKRKTGYRTGRTVSDSDKKKNNKKKNQSVILEAINKNLSELKESIKTLPSRYISGEIPGTIMSTLKDIKKIKGKRARTKSRLAQRTGSQYTGQYNKKGGKV